MEQILIAIISFVVVFPTITMIWFLLILNKSLKATEIKYEKMTKDEKSQIATLNKKDVFLALYFKKHLEHYLLRSYLDKEQKKEKQD